LAVLGYERQTTVQRAVRHYHSHRSIERDLVRRAGTPALLLQEAAQNSKGIHESVMRFDAQ
jgi:hypothetical protein